jgi:AcrR family transcriptional regulator
VAIAADVFRAKGFDAATLDDVAEALDMRRASIYYYVKSKGELLYLVIERALRFALDRLSQLERVDDPRRRLAALIRHQVETITAETSFFGVFFDDRPRLGGHYEVEIRRREMEYYQIYVSAVRCAAEQGVIEPVDARFGAQAILGMTTWAYKWFAPTDDVDAFADTCVELVLGTPRT